MLHVVVLPTGAGGGLDHPRLMDCYGGGGGGTGDVDPGCALLCPESDVGATNLAAPTHVP